MMKTNPILLAFFCFIAVTEAAWGDSAGDVIYPKEIQNCEPCKRLWLANNKRASHVDRSLSEKKVAEASRVVERKTSSAVIYPKEIENCEPCKRLWLVNRKKSKSDAAE